MLLDMLSIVQSIGALVNHNCLFVCLFFFLLLFYFFLFVSLNSLFPGLF